MKERVYIAGPMTGIQDYNFPAFFEAERFLVENGYEVVNPAKITNAHGGQQAFVKNEVVRNKVIAEQQEEISKNCDGLVLLSGWQNSKGTLAEIKVAHEHGVKIHMMYDLKKKFSKNSN